MVACVNAIRHGMRELLAITAGHHRNVPAELIGIVVQGSFTRIIRRLGLAINRMLVRKDTEGVLDRRGDSEQGR